MNKNKGRRLQICTKLTNSYGNFGPAREVCKVACEACSTENPTKRPNVTPTKIPTKLATPVPTMSVTSEPTESPGKGNICCSQFFDVCKPNPYCQESEENCTTCNGVFLFDLPKSPEIYTPRYGMCSSNEDKCCYPSKCVKKRWYWTVHVLPLNRINRACDFLTWVAISACNHTSWFLFMKELKGDNKPYLAAGNPSQDWQHYVWWEKQALKVCWSY